MAFDDRVDAGQAVYTPRTLRLYDRFVLGFSNRLIWHCPTPNLEALYVRNVSDSHLDIGVGTGHFLDAARWPVPDPQITLVDLNRHSLDAAARRIARHSPHCIQANALEPLLLDASFTSVGICYLLHCLPGNMAEKAVVFDHAAALLRPGGTLFGATIVRDNASVGARALMRFYNRRGIFTNQTDTIGDVERELADRFDDVRIEVHGNVVLFEARRTGVAESNPQAAGR